MNDLYDFIIHFLITLLVGIHIIESVKSEIDDLYNQLRKTEKTLDDIKKSLWIENDDN